MMLIAEAYSSMRSTTMLLRQSHSAATNKQQYKKRCKMQCAVSRESLGLPNASKEVDEQTDNVQELS